MREAPRGMIGQCAKRSVVAYEPSIPRGDEAGASALARVRDSKGGGASPHARLAAIVPSDITFG